MNQVLLIQDHRLLKSVIRAYSRDLLVLGGRLIARLKCPSGRVAGALRFRGSHVKMEALNLDQLWGISMRSSAVRREVYFEDIFTEIARQLQSARYSIKVCVAWISADRIRDILLELRNRGISIEIVYNASNSNVPIQKFEGEIGSTYPISNWLGGFMHNKFCVIDDEVLITGSFNWTHHADISLENALVIIGDYSLIKAYLHEFEDLKHYSRSNFLQRPIQYLHGDATPCASLIYNVGVFGYLDGSSGAQQITIWSVCNKHRAVHSLKTIRVDSCFDDESDLDSSVSSDWHESREGMLEQFLLERRIMDAPRGFLSQNLGFEVHAYGTVQPAPLGYKIDEYADSDFCVDLSWRHMYWRKIIPSKLFYSEGDVWKIVQTHRPNATSR